MPKYVITTHIRPGAQFTVEADTEEEAKEAIASQLVSMCTTEELVDA